MLKMEAIPGNVILIVVILITNALHGRSDLISQEFLLLRVEKLLD